MAASRVRAGALLACGAAGLVAASGCSSSSQPSWAPALGPGVTVTAPAQVAPGHGSPGAAIAGLFAAIGYVAVHGDQALVGSTGTFCVPAERPRCFTNTDPAALLSGGKPFGTLWAQADRATSSNVYKLAPCVKIGGRWYLHLPSS